MPGGTLALADPRRSVGAKVRTHGKFAGGGHGGIVEGNVVADARSAAFECGATAQTSGRRAAFLGLDAGVHGGGSGEGGGGGRVMRRSGCAVDVGGL
jgi:hypothetical protein